jgi:hypothetical protein
MHDLSTMEPHPFIRPGQVAPHLPAPDHCAVCGQPEAAHNGGYAREAAAQDGFLDRRLAEIRAAEAAGHITIRESADLRIAALEHHIEAVKNLRREFFGNGDSQ